MDEYSDRSVLVLRAGRIHCDGLISFLLATRGMVSIETHSPQKKRRSGALLLFQCGH